MINAQQHRDTADIPVVVVGTVIIVGLTMSIAIGTEKLMKIASILLG